MTGNNTALITGATGLLGRQVVREFRNRQWTVRGLGLSRADGTDILKVDLTNGDEIAKALDEVKPQVVVHCAASRYPDKVEANPEAARALNHAATQTLARLCAARSIFLIYISTDYVFAGKPGEAPYKADASTDAPNLYGQLKLDGEVAIQEEFSKAGKDGLGVVLRVPVLYGSAEVPAESSVNSLMDTVWKAQTEGAKTKVDHWALRYPTNTEDVGRVCHDIAAKYLSSGPEVKSLPRVLQFSSEDRFTKYEICQLFAEIMGLSMGGLEADTKGNDPSGPIQRPYDCHLSTETLESLGISIATCDFKGWWRREVRAFRK